MGREAVQRAWAEALFDLASDSGKVDEFEAGLNAVASQFDAVDSFRPFATTPRVSPEEKQAVLTTAFGGKLEAQLVDALKLMADRRRLVELPGIALVYQGLVDEAEGRQRVKVTTAIKLDDGSRSALTKAIGDKLGKTVLLEEHVDPDVIAGLIIEYGDVRVDGSMQRRLRNFLRTTLEQIRAPKGD